LAARRTFAAWSRRDWELNTLLLDGDDYEFMIGDPAAQAPGMRERYEGILGYLDAQTTMLEVFTDMGVDLERIGWAPDGRVAGLLRFRGTAGASGVAVDQRALIAAEFRRGVVVRQWYWWDVQAGSRSLGIDFPRR
jgi:ketosteroid isomerase-like protein